MLGLIFQQQPFLIDLLARKLHTVRYDENMKMDTSILIFCV